MRKSYVVSIVLGGAALLLSGAAYGMNKLNQPVQGTIITSTRPAQKAAVTPDKSLKTSYYATRYPARYDLSPKPLNSASLDAEVLVAHEQARFGTGSRITLTVENLPAGGVTEASNYKLYASQPNLYTISQQIHAGDATILTTRTDPNYQAIVLWPHGNLLLTVSLTGDKKSAELDADLATILQNIVW